MRAVGGEGGEGGEGGGVAGRERCGRAWGCGCVGGGWWAVSAYKPLDSYVLEQRKACGRWGRWVCWRRGRHVVGGYGGGGVAVSWRL